MMADSKYSFEEVGKTERYHHRAYDGFYYNGRSMIFSKGSKVGFITAKIFTDSNKNVVKLEHGDSKDFKPDQQGRLSCSNLPVPSGRYIRIKGVDVNGAIYALSPPK